MKKTVIIKSITNRESYSLDKYFQEIGKYNLLTKDEEIELSKKIKDISDRESINKLINSNLRFVITVVKQYQNQGLPLLDLISEGNLGLIKAANKFDYSKGVNFISYAVWWIKQSILQALTDHSRTVRLPLNQVNNLMKINKILEKIEQEHERLPSNEEISKLMSIKIGKVDKMLNMYNKTISIDEPVKSGNSETHTLIDILENENSTSPDNNLMHISTLKEIEEYLDVLKDRDKQIITLFFNHQMTLSDIGEKIGISKERVRQIRDRSIRKMRASFKYR